VNDEPRPGPARCFQLTIHFGMSTTNPCRAPIAWQGVIRTADGLAYRVLSCEVHANRLEDRQPCSSRFDPADNATDPFAVFSQNT
jgi:hypothetical protein